MSTVLQWQRVVTDCESYRCSPTWEDVAAGAAESQALLGFSSVSSSPANPLLLLRALLLSILVIPVIPVNPSWAGEVSSP